MTDKRTNLPPGGILLGRLIDPFDPMNQSEEGQRMFSDDPMTASDALQETLEGQGKELRPE